MKFKLISLNSTSPFCFSISVSVLEFLRSHHHKYIKYSFEDMMTILNEKSSTPEQLFLLIKYLLKNDQVELVGQWVKEIHHSKDLVSVQVNSKPFVEKFLIVLDRFFGHPGWEGLVRKFLNCFSGSDYFYSTYSTPFCMRTQLNLRPSFIKILMEEFLDKNTPSFKNNCFFLAEAVPKKILDDVLNAHFSNFKSDFDHVFRQRRDMLIKLNVHFHRFTSSIETWGIPPVEIKTIQFDKSTSEIELLDVKNRLKKLFDVMSGWIDQNSQETQNNLKNELNRLLCSDYLFIFPVTEATHEQRFVSLLPTLESRRVPI